MQTPLFDRPDYEREWSIWRLIDGAKWSIWHTYTNMNELVADCELLDGRERFEVTERRIESIEIFWPALRPEHLCDAPPFGSTVGNCTRNAVWIVTVNGFSRQLCDAHKEWVEETHIDTSGKLTIVLIEQIS